MPGGNRATGRSIELYERVKTMTTIRQDDLIQSVADAFQHISYYHPVDYIKALTAAWEREESPAAKDAMAQILINSRMAATGHRPICQDTGIAVVFLKVGMEVRWEGDLSLAEMINEGVRRAYTNPDNVLRASVLADPAGKRQNTRDNTPAVIHTEIVPGNELEVICAAKGGGSENKAKFVMLNPSDSLVDWVVNTVPTMGAGWCPPGILGLGIGGTPEKAMLMAKESLMAPVNIHELQERGPANRAEELRLELFDKVNALGIGAQGLGGLTTVLDIKVMDCPTHAASLPVAMIPNCAATRHAHFTLRGDGPAELKPPSLADWPELTFEVAPGTRRVNLDTVTAEEAASWQPGDTLLLSGKLLTGRDAAHKRIQDLLASGEGLPEGVDFNGGRPGRSDDGHAHGQVHRHDARQDRPARHGRQGRARPGRDRLHPRPQGGLPDRRRWRRLPGLQGDPQITRGRVRGTRHGGDPRVRGRGDAGDRRRRQPRRVGAQGRSTRVAEPDRQDSGDRGLTAGT
jgi:fumarate hydratase class I